MRSIPVLPVPAGLDCPGQPDKTFGILFEPANEREKRREAIFNNHTFSGRCGLSGT
jgi:hypothetical protein